MTIIIVTAISRQWDYMWGHGLGWPLLC